jgi:hypothetical protein
VNPNEMPKLKEDVVTILCMLEMEMPIAFFDVMTHLVCIWLKSSIYVA